VAKAVLDYAKKNDKLKVTSGIFEGEFCDAAKLKSRSLLPPREALLGTLAGCMQAPASKFARLLSATVTRMGYAMNALREKRAQEQ
jgi:large subunit ribosomal protein L10